MSRSVDQHVGAKWREDVGCDERIDAQVRDSGVREDSGRIRHNAVDIDTRQLLRAREHRQQDICEEPDAATQRDHQLALRHRVVHNLALAGLISSHDRAVCTSSSLYMLAIPSMAFSVWPGSAATLES
ncbi:unnamed protein product [Phytophthora lilii]|uniref:Unnamed protein product n=1 Tax=Phytophthora lilii TaxID=2077276 RepID=A0A9W6TXI9_9STRA|nr:unnamed protein product [Phytophthora lilii]